MAHAPFSNRNRAHKARFFASGIKHSCGLADFLSLFVRFLLQQNQISRILQTSRATKRENQNQNQKIQ